MKNLRIVLALILTLSLTLQFSVMGFVKVSADDGTIFNLEIKDYYKYSGKILLYFNEMAESKGYNVYMDDETTPTKVIKSSGGYLTEDELGNLEAGDHTIKVTRVNESGIEEESASAVWNKEGAAGTYTDIPQIYIYTDEEITSDYHADKNVSITLVDKKDGNYSDIIDSQSNIKIRGNSTASADKKPWNIKFNSKREVLGMTKGKKWCLLANAYDKSLIRNKLALEMGHKINMSYTSESRYVEVYINGTYNGNYLLTTPVEVKKERVNIDAYNPDSNDILLELGTRYESDVNHFKTGVLQTIFDINDPEKDGDLTIEELNSKITRVKNYLDEFETALTTGEYGSIANYMDVNSFVDFYVVSEFFKNADFNFSSTRFYIKDNKVYAGPLWDFDLSCGNLNPTTYSDYYDDGVSYKNYRCRKMNWYAKLFETDWFEELVKKRYEKLQYVIQNIYMEDSVEPLSIKFLIDNYGMSYARDCKSKNKNGAGWPLGGGGGYIGITYTKYAKWKTWDEPIEFVREWMSNRNQWLCEQWNIDMEEAYAKYSPGAEPEGEEESTTEISTNEESSTESTTNEESTTESVTNEGSGRETTCKNTTNIAESTKANNIATALPKKTKIKKVLRKKKRRIKVRLKRVSNIKGYQVKIAANKKFSRKVITKKYKKESFVIRVKKRYKKFFIKARTYVKIDGRIKYSKWCRIKVVKNI